MSSLNVRVDQQKGRYLCWAAVTAAVARFFNGPAVTQCALAQRLVAPAGTTANACCNDPVPDLCDRPAKLQDALGLIHHYDKFGNGLGSIAELQTKIDQSRPVALRVQFNDGQGHFVLVSSYTDDGDFVTVCDSDGARVSQVRWSELAVGYRGGRISHRLFTR